jgi:hypothetical protein
MTENKKELKLATYWQLEKAKHHKQVVSPLTRREVGQIKSLFLKTGMLSRRLMDFAFAHWGEFTTRTMAVTGFPACPQQPHIGYLLKHREIAISSMIEKGIIDADEAELALLNVRYIDE